MQKRRKELLLDTSLATKIKISYLVIIIPMFIFITILCSLALSSNKEHDRLIRNASIASAFSIDFKRDFDYKIYLIIVGNKTIEELDPFADITQANEIVEKIKNSGESKTNRIRIVRIQKYLRNLSKYVNEIEKNIESGNMYDQNINIWENDVQVVTSLIQDTILEILYYETKEIQASRADMEAISEHMMNICIILAIAMLCLTFILSAIIPKSITKPIRYLGHITEQVSKGDLSIRSKILYGAEVKNLSNSLNIMIQKISDLFETVKMEQKKLREAELELLQIQINPHFLYNTLDTIVWLAEGGNQKEVVNMVEALSDFFRSSLNQGNDIITIEQETFHLACYFKIQQVRYQDILEYEVNIPPEMWYFLIPKITLQPLVENALYHGIKNKRRKGKITVTGRIQDKTCILAVEDNGIGMEEKQLNEVLKGITEEKNSKENFFGLFNVNERIQLKFGDKYGIRIFSQYEKGTRVEVHLPCST